MWVQTQSNKIYNLERFVELKSWTDGATGSTALIGVLPNGNSIRLKLTESLDEAEELITRIVRDMNSGGKVIDLLYWEDWKNAKDEK